jgi:type IV pilus assembly protein PilP
MKSLTFPFFEFLIAVALCTAGTAAAQQKPSPSPAPANAVGDILSKPAAVKAAVDAAAKKAALDDAEPKPPAANPESPAADQKIAPDAAPRLASFPKRDPFRPYTVNTRNSNARRRENLSPLERYDLGQLKLVAVIWNAKEPTAMVEDASGLGYLIKIGTPIGPNDGKVKAIQRNGILIEEYTTDLYGVTKKQESSMRLSVESAG